MTAKRKITLYVLVLGLVLGLFLGLFVANNKNTVCATSSTSQMETGVSFRSRWYIRQCGLVYTGSIGKSEWESLESSGYTANLFITSYNYITGLSTATASKYATAKTLLANNEYVEAFESAGLRSITVSNITPTLLDGKYYVRGGVKDIRDENLNMEYFGVVYYEKDNGDGTFTRIYSSVADRSTVAKSMCYVATAVYNTTYSTADDDTLANLEHFMTVAAKSATTTVPESVDTEVLAERPYEELVDIEIDDMTYGDDKFSYKIYSVYPALEGDDIVTDITAKYDGAIVWSSDDIEIDGTSVSGSPSVNTYTVSAQMGKFTKDISVKVNAINLSTGTASVSNVEAIRTSNLPAGARPDVTVSFAATSKRSSVLEHTFTYANTEVAYTGNTAFGTATATATGSGNYTGSISKNFTISQTVFTLSTNSTTNGSISLSTTSSVADETITVTATPSTGYHLATVTYNGNSATVVGNTATFTMPGENVTVSATFSGNTYTVTYNANGGSGTMSASTHTYGTSKTLTENAFTKTGYTFTGWATASNGSKVYNDQDSVLNLTSTAGDNIDLYALWSPITYTVVYNAYGGSGSTESSSHTYDVAKALTANGFSRTGYTYKGWATSAGGDVVYTDGQSVSNLSSTQGATVNLYAVWQANTYTVNFNAATNYGYISSGSASKTVTYASTYGTLPTATKGGYTFTGWFTAVSGGTEIKSTTIVSILATQTLYAQFSAISYSYSYSFSDDYLVAAKNNCSGATAWVGYENFTGDFSVKIYLSSIYAIQSVVNTSNTNDMYRAPLVGFRKDGTDDDSRWFRYDNCSFTMGNGYGTLAHTFANWYESPAAAYNVMTEDHRLIVKIIRTGTDVWVHYEITPRSYVRTSPYTSDGYVAIYNDSVAYRQSFHVTGVSGGLKILLGGEDCTYTISHFESTAEYYHSGAYALWGVKVQNLNNYVGGYGYDPKSPNTYANNDGGWRSTYNELCANKYRGHDWDSGSDVDYNICIDGSYTNNIFYVEKFTAYGQTTWRTASPYICEYGQRGNRGTLFIAGSTDFYGDTTYGNISSGLFVNTDSGNFTRTGTSSIDSNTDISNWYWISTSCYCNVHVTARAEAISVKFTFTANSKTHPYTYVVEFFAWSGVNVNYDVDVVTEGANYVITGLSHT